MIKIGIIGGSGFYQLSDLKDSSEKIVDTEFGPPSDKLVEGTIYGVPVVVLARFFKQKFIYSIIFLLSQQSFYISSSISWKEFQNLRTFFFRHGQGHVFQAWPLAKDRGFRHGQGQEF